MKKEQWLIKEIDTWLQLTLIDADTADVLKSHYAQTKNISAMVVLFSVIGGLLIGAGIILLFARNWDSFPIFLRMILSFIPLVVSQAFAVYVVKKRYESQAWRETIAIILTASVFTAIAMVDQIFHLPTEFGTYVLTCGLLSLPVMYILDSASLLIIYYWTIVNWAGLELTAAYAPILLVLFAIGVFYIYLRKVRSSPGLAYLTWISVIAGFVVVLFLAEMLSCSLLLAVLCYFILLLSLEDLPEQMRTPFEKVGTAGGLVTTAILTYGNMWSYLDDPFDLSGGIMVGFMLAGAVFFATKLYSRDKFRFWFVASLMFLCILRFLWGVFALEASPYDILFASVSSFTLLAIGVCHIVYGVKNTELYQANVGMVAVCALIIMRFFDSGMDFFWRGVVFLILGTAFLLVNVKILRAKKQPKEGLG